MTPAPDPGVMDCGAGNLRARQVIVAVARPVILEHKGGNDG